MANKKLKNFEYANHSIKGKTLSVASDKLAFFESVNGFVFIICDGNIVEDSNIQPSELTVERIKYYLENEFVNDPSDAVYNAIVYANGFIFEYARKNPDFKTPSVSCSIILIRDNKCFYSAVGNASVDFFNGRKLFTLARKESILKRKSEVIDGKAEGAFIGESRSITPEVNKEALVPLNDDIILLSSDGFYRAVSEKASLKILNDPMPVQTKAYRLIDTAIQAGTEDSASVQIIAFYNLDHAQRIFNPLKTKGSRLLGEKLSKKKDVKSESKSKQDESSTLASVKRTLEQPATKYTLIILAALLVIYMFYDLFIYDPVPAVKITSPATEEISKASVDEASATADILDDTVVKVPDDRLYRVQSGDTWGRIYSRFGVCSWFIKNHPPNIGKFDSAENPIAGSQIRIPLVYSGNRDLNPDFYHEFSMDKTGSRCENANEEFLKNFSEKYPEVSQ